MKYITAQDILVMHAQIIDETGGIHGIRDIGQLFSLIERPKTFLGEKEIFKDVFCKAAAYLEAIANYHIFIDGNKRTAFLSAARFLFINGYEFSGTDKAIEAFMVKVVVKKYSVKKIAQWLRTYSRKSKK